MEFVFQNFLFSGVCLVRSLSRQEFVFQEFVFSGVCLSGVCLSGVCHGAIISTTLKLKKLSIMYFKSVALVKKAPTVLNKLGYKRVLFSLNILITRKKIYKLRCFFESTFFFCLLISKSYLDESPSHSKIC